MTVHVYNCQDCNKDFSVVIEHEGRDRRKCYYCGSKNIYRKTKE